MAMPTYCQLLTSVMMILPRVPSASQLIASFPRYWKISLMTPWLSWKKKYMM